MSKYLVANLSDINVGRGGVVFPAGKSIEVEMVVGETKYIEIKACCRLKILGFADKEKEVVKSVVTHETSKEKVEAVTKVSEESKVQVIKAAVKNTSENDSLFDSNDILMENTKEDTKSEDEPKKEISKGDFPCPYCDFKGTKGGIFPHVRLKHREKYEEFKIRMQSV